MMVAFLKILVGVAGTLLIGFLGIQRGVLPGSAATAQMALEESANAALVSAGADWAHVRFDGQKAIATGEAPSAEARLNVVKLLRQANWRGGIVLGAVTVVDTTHLTTYDGPPVVDRFLWIVERQDGAIVFSGHVPSQHARDEIFKYAARQFSGAEISGELEIAGGGPPEAQWLSAASTSLLALARLTNGAVEANGARFVLTGTAANRERAEGLVQLMKALPDGIEGVANLEIQALEEFVTAPAPPLAPAADMADGGSAAQTDAAAQAIADQTAIDQCRDRFDETIAATNIRFASARADINNRSRQRLRRIADVMRDCQQFDVEIIGHTDASGNQSRNRQLSLYRADAVAAYLRTIGVSARRLQTRGMGAAKPLVSNNTPAGRTQNRRIEFNFTFSPQE